MRQDLDLQNLVQYNNLGHKYISVTSKLRYLEKIKTPKTTSSLESKAKDSDHALSDSVINDVK